MAFCGSSENVSSLSAIIASKILWGGIRSTVNTCRVWASSRTCSSARQDTRHGVRGGALHRPYIMKPSERLSRTQRLRSRRSSGRGSRIKIVDAEIADRWPAYEELTTSGDVPNLIPLMLIDRRFETSAASNSPLMLKGVRVGCRE